MKPTDNDLFDILARVSKAAYLVFNDLKNSRDPTTNIATLPSGLTNSQLVARRTYLKQLKEEGIIRKVKTYDVTQPIPKNSWMINPECIKCDYNQEEAIRVWNHFK